MTDILQAARSYYGLADTESCTTQLYTNQAGQACVAFEIALGNEDFAAIVERMKAMQEAESQQVEQAPIFGEDLDTHAMRRQYNALSKAEKGKYGSFGKYMTAISSGIIEAKEELANPIPMPRSSHNTEQPDRQVIHVDAPEEPEPVSMDAVWISGSEANHAQTMFPVDYNALTNEYLIQWAMLTDEQKQKAKESGK